MMIQPDINQLIAMGNGQPKMQLAVDPGVLASIISDRSILAIAANIYIHDLNMSVEEACRKAFDLFDAFNVEAEAWASRKSDDA